MAGVLGDPQQADQRAAGNTQTLLAAFNQRGKAIEALLSNVSGVRDAGSGPDQRQPEPAPPARAVAAASPTFWSSTRTTLSARVTILAQLHGGAERGRRLGAVLQGDDRQPACRIRSCSRGSTRRSRSAASTRRTSGAVRGCRRSSGPTPTAPASPTARRRRRRRCWRAPRIIRGRPWRQDRRARTPRRRWRRRPGNPLPCAGIDQVRPVRRRRPYPAPLDVAHRRRTRTVCRRRRVPMPDCRGAGADVPGTPVPLPPNAPPGARRRPVPPARHRRRRRSPRLAAGRAPRLARARSYRCHSSRPAGTGGSSQ